MSVELNSLLGRKPGVTGGRLCAAGTGVSVRRIAVCHMRGESPEEILQSYPHLTLAQVYAALAYYYANREEIEADLAAEEEEYARIVAAEQLRKAAKA
jgi:uncharacterized protein (DUF433 family)